MASALLFQACDQGLKYPGPLSPEESLKSFRHAQDVRVEVFAAEPHVIDPVAMEFDEQGNVFVVGMLDAYKPDSVKGKGRIVMLRDRNDDGRADTAIIFADNLREATSVLPWNGGLLVAAAPHIYYMKDTSGDGRADLREILFTGFFNKNEEAQITNLQFGIDNWIYANNNGQAGKVTFSRKPGADSLSMKGWDFRFRLDRDQFEATSGRGQYGLAMDDWGHRFYTQNAEHISQVVIQKKYLDRNPFLPKGSRKALQNISDHEAEMYQLTPAPWWRAERTRQRNQRFRENGLPETERAEGRFTGGSGGTFYEGELLPAGYYGNVFTGDVAGSLAHRDVLRRIDSPYLKAGRAEGERDREFIASTDSWVRPASFTTGPDGSLFMIDMYRQHIETPLSIPQELQRGMDFDAGDKYGRIYRIVGKDAPALKLSKPDLRNAASSALVALLAHRNQWWRLQAQRLLLERQDRSVLPEVLAMFRTHPDARARLHALYVVEGLNLLTADLVKQAAMDKEAGIREHAAILAERFSACRNDLIRLTGDADAIVAFQATLSLGDLSGEDVSNALAEVMSRQGASPWFRTAVLSAPAGSTPGLLEALHAKHRFFNDTVSWKSDFVSDVAGVVRQRKDPAEVSALETFGQLMKASGNLVWKRALDKERSDSLATSKK
ncbi:MAG: dehydrogenase [Chitinophagaceae bacterium]|nr:dehydrogenase [Chitinophagaceae bacterium]